MITETTTTTTTSTITSISWMSHTCSQQKVSEIRLQKLPSGGFPKVQLFAVQNRCNLGTSPPFKTRGKRVSQRVLLKSSKMMSKNHRSGDRQKSKFSAAIMIIIWTPLSLQKANECCTMKGVWKTSVWKKKKNWELAQPSVDAHELVLFFEWELEDEIFQRFPELAHVRHLPHERGNAALLEW